MRKQINKIYHDVLVFLHLSPLSLAEKCRIAFGAAVVLVLGLALSIPYIWMGQLTKKAALDAGRTKVETLLRQHFQPKKVSETTLAPLSNTGAQIDPNHVEIQWIKFTKEENQEWTSITETQKKMVKMLKSSESRDDTIQTTKEDGVLYSNYVRVFRARESCISCHNPQGSAGDFSHNEPVGAAIIKKPAGDASKATLMNRVLIIVAGLIGGVGAIVTFYVITQRVILRPIRQLRALANNVAEGNLDIRSSIKTRDEYENLSEAFNHMLDGLQAAQQKLRQANIQLDGKIVELSERNIELFKANKLKDEFLANITHEFRTPLNAILGFAEILREKPEMLAKDKTRRYAENIITGGKSLLNMINDLLDMAKSEAGKMKLHIDTISLKQLCQSAVVSFAGLTRKKKIKVKLKIDSDVPELTTDGGKVQQILYNFLSNAVKFTEEKGRIEINASMIDEKHVRIAASDTGCGIADADKEKVFEKFRQIDGSITRESTGSGLGLAICTELAAMLAGTIGMESKINEGSTFWLDIPVAISKDEGSQLNQENDAS